MTDKETIKASGEINSNKIKAIYPHIVVSGNVDKPYYSIQWYDIEKKTMFDGYASYELNFVREWLQENFEVVETDIDDLINRQQAEIERYKKYCSECGKKTTKTILQLQEIIADKMAEIERLKNTIVSLSDYLDILGIDNTDTSIVRTATELNAQIRADVKAEAIKEFAERLCKGRVLNDPVVIAVKAELKEMLGDTQ